MAILHKTSHGFRTAGAHALAAAVLFGAAEGAWAQVYQVGPTRTFHRPSEVAAIAGDGDVVEIDAAVYTGDVAVWHQNRLTLRGVSGRAYLKAAGQAAEGKAIWVIKGKHTTVERIEFSDAAVSDGNGAGIRPEGADLIVRDCFFHDNQNGILGGAGNVLVEYSEFARNGAGDGRTHNIYISDRTERFTLRYSYSHHANVGHSVKSRARENVIEYNRLMDETDGNASYQIDIPDGGIAYIIGNLVHKGRQAENATLLSYGAEEMTRPRNELYVVNNTFVNDRHTAHFVRVAAGKVHALVVNNLFVGIGDIMGETIEKRANLTLADAKLVDRAHYDYRLTAKSPAIDAGIDPGRANGRSLVPTAQYVHPLNREARTALGNLDVGAYEFDGGARR